jgi:hypothetical protein
MRKFFDGYVTTKHGNMIKPMYCDKCKPWRGASATILKSSHEMFWNSFQMCEHCHNWINDPANKDAVDALEKKLEQEGQERENAN